MKRTTKLIISFFFCLAIILCPSKVKAADSLGTCNYTIDTNKLALANLDSLSLTVTVYDDGTTGNRKISTGSSWSATPKAGLLIGDQYYLQYKKMFDKNGLFYKGFKEKNNCPDLQFIYYVNTSQISFNVGGGVTDDNNPTYIASTKATGAGSSSTSKEKIYCKRNMQPLNASGTNISITFKEQNGKKTALLESDTGVSSVLDSDGMVTFLEATFSMESKDVNKYWGSTCETTGLYFRAVNGDQKQIVIQSSKPSDVENGSYSAVEAKYDDGFTAYDTQSSLEGLNQEISCNQLIDMSEGKLGWIIQKILDYIKIAGPILVILLSAVDYIKAIASSEEDAYKKAQSKLIIRLIAALALFLIPTIVSLLLGLINGIADPTCGLR